MTNNYDDFEDLRISGSKNINDNDNNDQQIVDSTNAFNKVSKELENDSIQYRKDYEKSNDRDIELGEVNNGLNNKEDFKLIKYFESSQRQLLENGHKVKKMGVSIKNLTVVGEGADSSVIIDNLSPIRSLVSLFNPNNWRSKKSTFNILNDVNGYIEDGKMLLVLGRPGSGCSTLLRVISNQRDSYVDVTGEINYGNIPAEKWKYRGESIYTPEEDIHYPTLTVHETLDFALKLKTPSNRLPDENKRDFRTKIYDLLVSMYGLVNQRNTMVGNEFVRGISGGERKRTTIAEAMVSGASIISWDSSTRGLDSASAYDYAKSLRIMSNTLHKTTIASFYQASDNIYNLFDKVLILDKGRCIYFGPTHLAKQYFVDLGFKCDDRKSVPDFITGVTNPQERILRSDLPSGHKVPETSADFEDVWKKSPLYHQSLKDQEQYEAQVEAEQPSKEFLKQVLNEKSKTSSEKSPYSASFFAQVMALTFRQLELVWGDKFAITSKFLTVFVQSWIYGAIYFQLDKTTDGLFTRGGAIFSSIIFNSFLTQGELHNTFVGRRILQKHKSYALYRPSAYFISQVLVDFPFAVTQVILHSIISYFMYGLDYDAGKFFYFVATLIAITLACASLFRAFGNFTPSLYVGQNLMNIVFLLMVTYFGYTIPYEKMHPWFQWIYWVHPMSYAFNALMANEFMGLDFTCKNPIPSGPSYTDDAYRICAITGSVQGQLDINGANYLQREYSINVDERGFNIAIVFALWIFYVVINLFAIEFFDWTSGGYTHKVYKRGKAPKLNDLEEEKNINKTVQAATEKMKENLNISGGIFTWNEIKYTVPVPEGQRLLLDDVMGWIKPGQMTALMGSSGAGKTTLLDVLAKRKTLGIVEGQSYLNGKPLAIDFERITGYVEQMDVHNPGLTVREALRFSAKLRQEPEISLKEKYGYVEHVLEMMEMKHLGDALIGNLDSGIGISVEERKRLTIGLELVAKPHILFLDEPTSGLDAQSSYNIIKFIRKLADAGMPLVCTIHQPSSVLFEHFDRILLLAKGGKTVYFGDIGEKSSTLINYFQNNGGRVAQGHENPAEYILDVIGAGVHGSTDIDWPSVWKNSKENTQNQQELDDINSQNNIPDGADNEEKPAREFATSFAYQLKEVYKRLNVIYWRDPFYTIGGWFQMAISGLIIGFTFFNIQDSSSDMNQRIFFIWESLILGVLLIYLALPQFFIQKEYFKRDYASKYYSWHSFSLAIVAVEIPYITASTTIFFCCAYWTSGLETSASAGFYYWLFFVIFAIYCVTFGQSLGAFAVNLPVSIAVLPIVLIYLFLFCGVQVSESQIPYFLRSWVYPLNPCKYFIEGVLTTVLEPIRVTCTNEDLIKFTPPANQTCEQYTANWNPPIGYKTIVDGNPNECGYCIFKQGSDFYETQLNFQYENRWRNFGILCSYIAFNILVIITFVYLNRKSRR